MERLAPGLRAVAALARVDERNAVDELLGVAALYGAAGQSRPGVAVAFRAMHLSAGRLDALKLAPVLDRLGPDGAILCRHASDTHLELGRPIHALEILYLHTLLEPRSPEPFIKMAALYGQTGLVRATGVCLMSAARRFAANGNNAEQIATLEYGLDLDASHLDIVRDLARAYWRVGDHDAALRSVASVLLRDPDDAMGLELLARSFAERGLGWSSVCLVARIAAKHRREGAIHLAHDLCTRAVRWAPHDGAHKQAILALREAA